MILENEKVIWNEIAPVYEEEVFNVYKNDKKKLLTSYVKKYANKNKSATDFGCGIGNGLPLLSPSFKNVLAIDISQDCINRAAKRGYKNVTFGQVDLAYPKKELPKTDFGVCCNVAILSDNKKNFRILKNVLSALKKGGTVLFVLPSMESASFSKWRLANWHHKDGVALHDMPKEDLDNMTVGRDMIAEGMVNINGQFTKHYLLTEIYSLLTSEEFKIKSVDRIEYTWDTEFTMPPKWMQAPYPWDWLVEVRRVK